MLLVTGGTGYLGRVLLELLVRRGHPVRAAVRDLCGARQTLPPEVEVVPADLADGDGMVRAARGCSGVLHLAGSVGAGAEETWRLNVDGTATVLAAARAAGRVQASGNRADLGELLPLVPPRTVLP